MSATNGNGRIHLLSDHQSPKPTKAEQQFEQTKGMIEHYMVQIPGLVASALESALKAYDDGRRDEFAAWVMATDAEKPITLEQYDLLHRMMAVFGPRKPMPEQPEVQS